MVNFANKDLVLQLKLANEEAFEYVYRSFFSRLDFFANQYLLDKEASKGIVQDVFTELWARKQFLTDDTNIQAWLFTVTKNKSLKYISKLKSKGNYEDYLRIRQLEINYQSLEEFDTENFTMEELKNRIELALDKLSPSCRKVFELSRYQGLKNREIADELDISIKTVESHISKALRILRVELKEYLPLLYLLFSLKK